MEQNNRLPVFKERLEELRKLMGNPSNTEFAKTIGISRQTLGFYLNGDRIPDCETLAQICCKCNTSANWLLGLSEDPNLLPSAADELGLSQANIAFLKDPSASAGRYATVPRFNKLVHSLINDIIDICREKRLYNDFQMMMHILKRHYGLQYMEDIQDLPSGNDVMRYNEHNGLFVLYAEDGIEYFANKIGSRISNSLIAKYYDSKEEAHKIYAYMLSERRGDKWQP